MPGGGRSVGAVAGDGGVNAGAICGAANAGGAASGDAIIGAGAGRGAGAGAGATGRGVEATMSCCAGAWTLVFSSTSSPTPIESSILVSPTTIVSPDWSLALLTFWPLTNVPFVDPRSMMLTSPGPLTSIIACMRDTVSSSSLRCADGTFPSLMTDRLSFSSRISWSPLKMRNVSGTFAPAMSISSVELQNRAGGAGDAEAPSTGLRPT